MKKLITQIICIVLGTMLSVLAACTTSGTGDYSGKKDKSEKESPISSEIDDEQESDDGSVAFKILKRYDGQDVDLTPMQFSAYLSLEEESDMAEWLYNNTSTKIGAVASKDISFSWKNNLDGAYSFTLVISDKEDFSNIVRLVETMSHSCKVSDLLPNRYYYKIIDNLGNETESDTFTVVDYVRSFSVASINNMRDLGGWKTEDGKTIKYGVTYRSGELNSGCGNALTNLGIKYEIDLRRNKSGNDYSSSVVPSSFNISFLQAGIMQGDYVLKDKSFYDLLTPEQIEAKGHANAPFEQAFATSLYNAFKLYTDSSNFPILFHCTSGADRTGTFAFLLEGLLGVELDDCYRDFELTSITMAGKRWRSNIEIGVGGKYYFTDDGFVTRDGNYIAIGLLYKGLMYSYSTGDGKLSSAIKNYLKKDVGLTDADIQAIKDNLLE